MAFFLKHTRQGVSDVGLGKTATYKGIPCTRRSGNRTRWAFYGLIVSIVTCATPHLSKQKNLEALLERSSQNEHPPIAERRFQTEYLETLASQGWKSPYAKVQEAKVDPERYELFVDCTHSSKPITGDHDAVVARRRIEESWRRKHGVTGREIWHCNTEGTHRFFVVETQPVTYLSSSAPSSSS